MNQIEREIAALPVSTFAVAAVEWQKHECASDSDVCGCAFRFSCTRCGLPQVAYGESMPFLIGIGGLCEGCHYGVSASNADYAPTPDHSF
jgi:hypothetical protein